MSLSKKSYEMWESIKKILRSPKVMITIFAIIAVIAVIVIVLGIMQEKPGFLSVCLRNDQVIYENMGERTTGSCESDEILLWQTSRIPLRVRASTDNPTYHHNPESVMRAWIDQFNDAFDRELFVYVPEGDVDVNVHLGATIEIGDRHDSTAHVSHTAREGELHHANVHVQFIPSLKCETHVVLHELGHVFMLAHSHGLMEPITRCESTLRIVRFPDHMVRLIQEQYTQ